MRRLIFAAAIGIAGFILNLAVPAHAMETAKTVIRSAGSSTIKPIVEDAAAIFEKKHPGLWIKIEGGGSSLGVKSVANGEVDLGNASRHLKPEEKEQWPDLIPHLVAMDGVAIILNKHVGIQSITKAQIQDLFTGKITNWKELGGADLPVYPISKEFGRSTLDLFLEYAGLEAKEENGQMFHRLKGGGEFSQTGSRIIGANDRGILQTAWKDGAISYVSVGDAIIFAEKTGKISLPKMDGVEVSVENVKNGTFPITRPLHVITKGQPQGLLKEFVEFLTGTEGRAIVKQHDFVPVGE